MNALKSVRMVLWSFLGIRRRAGAEEELAEMRPIVVIVAALSLAGGFVAALVTVAQFAARRLG